MRVVAYLIGLMCISSVSSAANPPPLPTSDKAGSADSPALRRFAASIILAFDKNHFDEASLPLSKLEPVSGKRDNHNNAIAEPKKRKTVSGEATHLVYVLPAERSSLEAFKFFQDDIKSKRGTLLYECKTPDCGGNVTGNSLDGGSSMSLPMYLRSGDKITDPAWSLPWCSAFVKLTDLRYFVAQIPATGATVSVLTANMPDASGACTALHARTLAVVDIIQGKPSDVQSHVMQSSDMARALTSDGKAVLYGIDPNSTDPGAKATYEQTLAQVAKLMTDSPELKLLVVSHTDNVGGYKKNVEASNKQATVIVKALNTKYSIKSSRLTAIGASGSVPIASNETQDGRTKNRRIELVSN